MYQNSEKIDVIKLTLLNHAGLDQLFGSIVLVVGFYLYQNLFLGYLHALEVSSSLEASVLEASVLKASSPLDVIGVGAIKASSNVLIEVTLSSTSVLWICYLFIGERHCEFCRVNFPSFCLISSWFFQSSLLCFFFAFSLLDSSLLTISFFFSKKSFISFSDASSWLLQFKVNSSLQVLGKLLNSRDFFPMSGYCDCQEGDQNKCVLFQFDLRAP